MRKESFDYDALCSSVEALSRQEALRVTRLGKSILGRDLPMLMLGEGKRSVLYVGGVRGTEGECAFLLMRFVEDYLEQLSRNSTVFEYAMQYLFREYRIYILPMLNPDGVSYVTRGVEAKNPLRERLLSMNGSSDFSAWEANARGVDLGRNFDVDFRKRKQGETADSIINGATHGYSGEYPESEPETAALCAFLRTVAKFQLLF